MQAHTPQSVSFIVSFHIMSIRRTTANRMLVGLAVAFLIRGGG